MTAPRLDAGKRTVPSREGAAALLLLASLSAALLLARPERQWDLPGLCTAIAVVYGAILWPAIATRGRLGWTLLPLLLVLPCLLSVAYAAAGAYLPGSLALLACALASGAAARALEGTRAVRFYLPVTLLIFLGPYAAAYLRAEFGASSSALNWRALSPLAGAVEAASGDAIPVAACVTLLLWPALASVLVPRRAR